MAPTTLPDTPPLEFIQAAHLAGFEGLGRDIGLIAAIEAPVGTLSPIDAI